MSRDRKDRWNQGRDKPAAPTPEPTIGGASAKDEVETAIANQIIGKLFWMLASSKPIQVAIADISPMTKLMFEGLPTAAAYAVAKLPLKYFRSPELASAFKDIVMDASKTINEIVQNGGSPKAKQVEQAIDKAITDVMSKMVAVDPLGQFHRTECVRLDVFRKQHQPQRKGKDGQPIPPPPLSEITLSEALKQKLCASPCCHEGIQAELAKDAAPAPGKRGRSVFEIIGATKDEELRSRFFKFFTGLSPEDRALAVPGLAELDSEEELVGFMAMVAERPEIAIESLPLLAERNSKNAVLSMFRSIGNVLKGGAESIGHRLEMFDQSFAPKVAELKKRRDERRLETMAKATGNDPESWWKRRVTPWLEALLPF